MAAAATSGPKGSPDVTTVAEAYVEKVYENQRSGLFGGFTTAWLLPTERRAWSDKNGNEMVSKDELQLPDGSWTWATEWEVEKRKGVDEEGWEYAVNWNTGWVDRVNSHTFVRRRKWIRERRRLVAPSPVITPRTERTLSHEKEAATLVPAAPKTHERTASTTTRQHARSVDRHDSPAKPAASLPVPAHPPLSEEPELVAHSATAPTHESFVSRVTRALRSPTVSSRSHDESRGRTPERTPPTSPPQLSMRAHSPVPVLDGDAMPQPQMDVVRDNHSTSDASADGGSVRDVASMTRSASATSWGSQQPPPELRARVYANRDKRMEEKDAMISFLKDQLQRTMEKQLRMDKEMSSLKKGESDEVKVLEERLARSDENGRRMAKMVADLQRELKDSKAENKDLRRRNSLAAPKPTLPLPIPEQQGATSGSLSSQSGSALAPPAGAAPAVAYSEDFTEVVYENQRSGLFGGYSTEWLLPKLDARGAWSREDGTPVWHKDALPLPDDTWDWITSWGIDMSGAVDGEGWEYAFSWWEGVWFDHSKSHLFVRRRKWIRKRAKRIGDLPAIADGQTAGEPNLRSRSLSFIPVEGSALVAFPPFPGMLAKHRPDSVVSVSYVAVCSMLLLALFLSVAMHSRVSALMSAMDGSELLKFEPKGEPKCF
eukprot:Opistho-1_new@6525